jgi:cellulose synthase/poly-beta-1,6-N-acetylglucosamine synthase-like glycosyltransferase
LELLTYPDFEVVVILDQLKNIPQNLNSDTRFKFISSGDKGPGEKRNIGAKISSGEILVFLDDDAYPQADWLDQASEVFKNPDIYSLGAPAVTPKHAPFLERCSGRVLESWLSSGTTTYRHIPSQARNINDYPTVNLFVRKSAFQAVGGFSTEFWPGEDTKLCLDLIKHYGYPFAYDPRPIVYHHRRNLFLPHLKQISRYGTYRGQFSRIYPETSRLPSYFAPSGFLGGLVFGPIICLGFPNLWTIYFGVISLYLVLLALEGTKILFKDKSLRVAGYSMMGIFLTHIVYGYSFIIGLLKKPKLKLREIDKKTGSYLGG